MLLFDPTAKVLSFYIISYCEALAELPEHLHYHIHYINYNVRNLTLSELQRLVCQHLKCDLKDLYCIHFSPCCKSYSMADLGKSGYRLADGQPNPLHSLTTAQSASAAMRMHAYGMRLSQLCFTSSTLLSPRIRMYLLRSRTPLLCSGSSFGCCTMQPTWLSLAAARGQLLKDRYTTVGQRPCVHQETL